MQFLLIIIAAVVVFSLLVQFWYLGVLAALGFLAPRVIRVIRKNRYFASQEFLERKAEIVSVVAEHNEISQYVDEIRANGTFSIGQSQSGQNANLATFKNTSTYNYKRDRNQADFSNKHVHNASLQVVRNASIEPIKYLIKYFDISPDEERLAEVEALGESVSRLENAINNLASREQGISESFAPPAFILKHYQKEFRDQVGLSIPALEVPYPKYVFQYLSAGGNSSQVTEVKLDSNTIDHLIEELSSKIRFKKSAAGQRSLMTASLRESIKSRDSYTCQTCTISVHREPHLLLEVDHIMPISKGGLSIETNLQTLCWKCNRTKSNKVLSE